MASRIHWPLKVIAFNENGIEGQRHELNKQLQDLHIDVPLFSETHLKPHERFHISNYNFSRIDRQSGMKGGTAVAVRKSISHFHVDLPPLISTEATGVCTPVSNNEILLAAVYRSPGRAWLDADVTELLSLVGVLNAKHPFWNSKFSNPSGEKLLNLFDLDDFQISAPHCPTHYSPAGNADVLDIVVHRNIRLSNVIVSDILDSDHLPIVFHILDHFRTTKISQPTEKLRTWNGFKD
jgi:hypothetical protein